MRILMAGAAALALAASGAVAQGNGNGKGNGGNKAAASQSQGNERGNRGGNDRQERRVEGREERQDRRADRMEDRRDRAADRSEERRDRRADRREDYRDNRADRIEDYRDRRADRNENRGDGRIRYGDRDDPRIIREIRDYGWLAQDRSRDLINGCPPGLAKKRNGCNPPGQVRDRYERTLFGDRYRPSLFGLSNYRRGDYYYNDGYLVRYGDSGISGWVPLLAGALGIGNVWPSGYRSYEVPRYYVDYYNLGGRDRYRYADNVIYRVNPEDAAITSIAALITGDEFTVGQPMPSGYDVYNVPYGYRDRYYDSPEYMYRYSDGYVYQIDPETRLVAAAIDLLI